MSKQEAKEKAEKAIQRAMAMVEASQSTNFRLIGNQVALWVQPLADYIKLLEEELAEREGQVRSLSRAVDLMRNPEVEQCKGCGDFFHRGCACPCGYEG